MKNDTILFSPCRIGKKTAPNRFAAQPMEANDGEEGKVSDRGYARYRELARGKWGIVIVEALSITRESLARKNGMILDRETADSFKKLVDVFKETDPDGLLFFQITHSGSKSGSAFSRKVRVSDDMEMRTSAGGNSGGAGDLLSTEELEKVKQRFVKAALLAHEAGADGVDFKLCHGYLGAELLRPSNIRNDKWGGSFENRTRLLREGIEEIQASLPSSDFILGSRISLYEAIRGGCGTGGPDEIIEDLSEMIELVKLMEKLGMDYINVSAGIPGRTSPVTRPEKQSIFLALHQLRYAKVVKEAVPSLPIIGSAYSSYTEEAPALAEENIAKGFVDFAGFGRQSFADPLYPKKLADNGTVDYCRLCSGCSTLLVNQVHTGCIIYNSYYRHIKKTLAAAG